MLKLIALVIPLGLDTFAVSAAVGVAGLSPRARLRLSLLFTAFEGGMPLVGLFAGLALSRVLAGVADLAAIALLTAIGVYMLVSRDDDGDGAQRLARTSGPAVLALGLSISLDELAIGFTLGLVKVPLLLAVLLVAGQAFLVSQLGFRVGERAGETVREGAERVAGGALIVIAAALAFARIHGIQL
ncbi:MAG TPA: manganese efflux pump [Candidatus Dormibacteraeota bacterium]